MDSLSTYFTNVGTAALALIQSVAGQTTQIATLTAENTTLSTQVAAAKATLDAINAVLPTPIAQP